MKTGKAIINAAVTPPQKKLKQARLPFKLISDVSPKPGAHQARKRKLSVPDPEPDNKICKISNENDVAEESVVISDDDSKSGLDPQKGEKPHNPFVKLVDTAWKKKLQKKTAKKKSKRIKGKSSKKVMNGSIENVISNDGCEVMETDDIEVVEVVVQIHTHSDDTLNLESDLVNDNNNKNQPDNETNKGKHTLSAKPENCDTPSETIEESETSQDSTTDKSSVLVKQSIKTVSEIFCIEDSNSCLQTNPPEFDTNVVESHTTIMEEEETRPTNKSVENRQLTPKKPEQDTEIKEVVNLTPKRSARNKMKQDEKANLNASTTSSKLDESVSSGATTPKTKTRSSSVTNSQGDTSLNESSTVATNLTPKQLHKKLESEKKREEREKEKQDREKKRQQEKEERTKQRLEKEEQKKRERDEKEEAKRKEREEKEEQRRKEREEKEKQRETEKKLKELKEEQKRKEKEDKEEQRKKEKEAKEEEKRKRLEAQELEKQEQELKKKKAADAFVNFFVPKQKEEKDCSIEPVSKNNVLSSFRIKVDMRLAPTVRVDLSDEKREALDKVLEKQNGIESDLYLKCLREGIAKPLSSGKTWPRSDKDDDDDDVMIVEDELPPIDSICEIVACEPAAREKLRPKLLSFHENRRPPYWGTWRKKSALIRPRRPLGQDEKQLDYEGDSDDEWEEEQEGESLDGSACGSDDEPDARDDYELDNELFVPHGYLSDEEGTMDEEDKDMLSHTPETQKARLKHLEDEFESEMKKPTEKLKPRLYGILWENKDGGKPDNCIDALWNYFEKFAMVLNDPTELLKPSVETEEAEKKKIKKKKVLVEGERQSPKGDKKKKVKSDTKESKKPKSEAKKTAPNQPGINAFLTKMKAT